MQGLTADSRVAVVPFTRQPSGDEFIVGWPETSTFLVLGKDVVEVLDAFATGKTLTEVKDFYRERYGEEPDLNDFLETLGSKGLVRHLGESESIPVSPAPPPSSSLPSQGLASLLARVLFGRIAVGGWIAVILAALFVLIWEPSLLPKRSALFFASNMTFFSILLLVCSLTAAAVHELAHVLAARAAGVSARIGLGNRLWILVAETDLSGVWTMPKSRRFLPILAGPLVDATSASALVLVLFLSGDAWRAGHPLAVQVLQALVLSYFLRIVWQCYLFVRTDFYYALIMWLDCRALMSDTTDFLYNQLRRLLRLEPRVDQSHIPARERKFIHWFSVPFVVGRCLAFWVLFSIQLPIVAAYFRQVAHNLSQGYGRSNRGDFIDSLVLSTIGMIIFFYGMFLWIRSMARKWRPAHGTAKLAA